MSAISLKSITGITSITTPAGVDNQLTLHTNNTTERLKIDEEGNVRVANTFDCVGVSTFRAALRAQDNLEIAGELVHLGDNDTRIRFPSNDTITFQTAGSERLRITSAGKVGIGTDLPQEELTIRSSTPALMLRDTDQEGSYTQVSNANQDMYFSANGTSAHANFIFRSGNAGSFLERLRIDSSGDMGLGTNTIENFGGGHVTLEVAGSTTSQGGVFKTATSDSAGTGSSGTEMIMFTDNTKGAINVVSSDPLTFSTANTERVRIDSSGYLIAKADIRLRRTASDNGALYFGDTNNNYIFGSDADDVITFATAGNERLRINSDGHVDVIGHLDVGSGIDVTGNITGTGTVVVSSSGNEIFKLTASSFTVSQYASTWSNYGPILAWDYKTGPGDLMYMASGGNTAAADQMALVISDTHGFKVGKSGYDGTDFDVSSSSEYFRINTSGFIGINDASPDRRLTITTSNEDALLIKNTNNAQYASARIHLQGPGSSDNVTSLVHGQLQAAGGDSYFAIESKTSSHVYKKTLMLYDHNTNHWAFHAGSADPSPERFRLFSDGSAELGNTGAASEFDGLRRLDVINKHSDTDSGSLFRLVTRDAGSANSTESFDIVKYRSGHVALNNNCATGDIDLYTGGAVRFRVDQNGKINCSYQNPGDAQYGNLEITKNGVSNVDANWSYLSFHRVGRIGFQQGLIVDDLVFATTGGAARNDLQNERFRIKSNGAGVVLPQDARLESAPNSTWGAGLYMGGNGNASSSTHGSMVVTNGNLHLDSRDGGYGCYLNWYGGTDGTRFGNGAGGQNGHMQSNGNLSITGQYSGSDLRLKENIQNISGATDTIKSLVGKTFTWKKEIGLDDWKHYGFIAQEVQKVVPDLVKDNGNQFFDKDDKIVLSIDPTESDEDRKNAGITKSLTVNNEGVTPILVEAMKELIAKVESLEAEVAALKSS